MTYFFESIPYIVDFSFYFNHLTICLFLKLVPWKRNLARTLKKDFYQSLPISSITWVWDVFNCTNSVISVQYCWLTSSALWEAFQSVCPLKTNLSFIELSIQLVQLYLPKTAENYIVRGCQYPWWSLNLKKHRITFCLL